MVHDSLCVFKITSKMSGELTHCYLKTANLKCVGTFGDAQVNMTIDGVSLIGNGLVGNYLLEKGYKFYVSEGRVSIKADLSNLA